MATNEPIAALSPRVCRSGKEALKAMRVTVVGQAGVSAICDKPMEPTEIHRLIERLLAS